LTFALDSVFMQTPYNHGTRQDLNSDTFKDIGSNATGSETTTTGYHIYANHGSGWYEGNSFKLGSGTFTLAAGSYQVGDTGTVTWAYWNRTVGTAAQKNNQHFQLDDVKYQVTGADSHLKNEPLTITYVPEPATMGLIALGGLALLRRRR